jgi:FAD-linked oxidoreductase
MLPVRPWRNWSGSVQASPTRLARPRSIDELSAVLRDAHAAGRTVRPVGSGHSFTPIAACDDLMVSLDHLQGLEAVAAGAGRVRVLGGTKLSRLSAELDAAGLAQENLGDINAQSIAGALGTGTHGTGATLGSIATQVEALTLVTAAGDVIECSREREPDLFEAARVSLGVLGVIARVTLRVQPAYRLAYRVERRALDEVLADIDDLKAAHRHFEFFWFPYSPWTMVKRQDITEAGVDRGHRLARAGEVVIDNAGLWLVSQIARARPALAPRIGRLSGVGFTTAAGVGPSHEVFATHRKVRFQEMEYNVPAEHVADVMAELRDTVERHRFPVHFAVEVRFVAPDDIWLSPAYERASGYVAVHAFRGMPYKEYFRTVEPIFTRRGGRPHWGKMHTQRAASLRERYPRFDDFLDVRADLDPAGTLLTPYLRELLGVV